MYARLYFIGTPIVVIVVVFEIESSFAMFDWGVGRLCSTYYGPCRIDRSYAIATVIVHSPSVFDQSRFAVYFSRVLVPCVIPSISLLV